MVQQFVEGRFGSSLPDLLRPNDRSKVVKQVISQDGREVKRVVRVFTRSQLSRVRTALLHAFLLLISLLLSVTAVKADSRHAQTRSSESSSLPAGSPGQRSATLGEWTSGILTEIRQALAKLAQQLTSVSDGASSGQDERCLPEDMLLRAMPIVGASYPMCDVGEPDRAFLTTSMY